jgi:hypothetical protein
MKRALPLFSLCWLFGASNLMADPPTTQLAAGVLAEYKIDHWGTPLLIPVRLQTKQAFFIVDTGCAVNVLDSTAFPDLAPFSRNHESVDADTPGGSQKMEIFDPPDLRVGIFNIARCGQVVRMDMSDLRAALGRPIIGILGLAAFKDFVVQIDYDSRTFRFIQSNFSLHPEWGSSSSMSLDSSRNLLFVNLELFGIAQDLTVDTGSGDFLDLTSPAFNHFCETEKGHVDTYPSLTAAGETALRSARVSSLELYHHRYSDRGVSETKATTGNIGLRFLEGYVATLDIPGRQLYLRPGKEIDNPASPFFGAGLVPFRLENQQVVAHYVHPGSAAALAGLTKGDILLEANGRACSDYDMYDLDDLLAAHESRELTVKFQRGTEVRTVKFKLMRDDLGGATTK